MPVLEDNAAAQVDNSSAPLAAAGGEAGSISGSADRAGALTTGWKGALRTDLKDSPFTQKFEDTPDGLNKALESYGNLEKLLGHEKVPVPKDVNDVEGWNRFSKAMGIPDKAEGYGLPDAKLPEGMVKSGLTLDKNEFAEVMHAHKVHPAAVKGIWETYQKMNVDAYNKAMAQRQEQLGKTVNALKSEWGDAYQTNVELGQMVINKFSDSAEMNDFLTTILAQDPRAIKFLAKIGDQFAENKIGEFTMKRFTVTPDEAREEALKMTRDMDGPYMNQKNKFTDKEHQIAIDRYNGLMRQAMAHR